METLVLFIFTLGVIYMTSKIPAMGVGSPAYDNVVTLLFPDDVEKWRDLATEIAHANGLSANLTLSIIWQESSGDENAFNGDIGTKGLMQIGPGAAHDMRVSYLDLYNPRVNIDAGVRYVMWLYRQLGTWELVLQAYNGGIGNVQRGTVSNRAVAYAESVLDKAGYKEYTA
jgi:soluble lytic murein transglycosylase-like protein